jgi:hypothetical protein
LREKVGTLKNESVCGIYIFIKEIKGFSNTLFTLIVLMANSIFLTILTVKIRPLIDIEADIMFKLWFALNLTNQITIIAGGARLACGNQM